MAAPSRKVQGHVAVFVARVEVGAFGYERGGGLGVAGLDGERSGGRQSPEADVHSLVVCIRILVGLDCERRRRNQRTEPQFTVAGQTITS